MFCNYPHRVTHEQSINNGIDVPGAVGVEELQGVDLFQDIAESIGSIKVKTIPLINTDDLDGHYAFRLGVSCFIHTTEAPFAD
ncbi:hypothetical protein UCRPA7_7802 [Phaeoacremonium minimum UCRPA7]|uniref:Uncharacterized protein n=1 Tax=Phaeoacremonium minimum (strain UCR-PA7) TaxID=1286976 RepID=R8BBN7_PHAM7|nr:hypothetical protein UCRPA7_7802 [Phaeoacremonium minimum UCRPA7]EON96697.1 hypothetical protein UCRPA7_7802 [Phaeoacremonium minimum UCRPA7]